MMAHMFQDYPPPSFFLLQKDMSLLLMLPGRDVCHVMEAQEVLGEWVVSLLRWHVLTAYADYHPHPNPILSPRLLQIYNQTDGSYMGSPEMSPLYSIVNALTQTAAAITLILAFLLSFSLAFSAFFFFFSLFLSAIFPGSISISHFPSLHILSCFCLAQNKCAHTHTHTPH